MLPAANRASRGPAAPALPRSRAKATIPTSITLRATPAAAHEKIKTRSPGESTASHPACWGSGEIPGSVFF